MRNPRSPGGIDAESPILFNGGTAMAFGTRNDAADSDSAMELTARGTASADFDSGQIDERGGKEAALAA